MIDTNNTSTQNNVVQNQMSLSDMQNCIAQLMFMQKQQAEEQSRQNMKNDILSNKIIVLEDRLETLEKENAILKEQNISFCKENANLKIENKKLKNGIEMYSNNVVILEKQNQKLLDCNNSLGSSFDKLESHNSLLEEEVLFLRKQLEETNTVLEEKNITIQNQDKKIHNLESKNFQLSLDVDKLQNELDRKISRIERLEDSNKASREEIKTMRSTSKLVKAYDQYKIVAHNPVANYKGSMLAFKVATTLEQVEAQMNVFHHQELNTEKNFFLNKVVKINKLMYTSFDDTHLEAEKFRKEYKKFEEANPEALIVRHNNSLAELHKGNPNGKPAPLLYAAKNLFVDGDKDESLERVTEIYQTPPKDQAKTPEPKSHAKNIQPHRDHASRHKSNNQHESYASRHKSYSSNESHVDRYVKSDKGKQREEIHLVDKDVNSSGIK
jgi:chromosome segregation ATPase